MYRFDCYGYNMGWCFYRDEETDNVVVVRNTEGLLPLMTLEDLCNLKDEKGVLIYAHQSLKRSEGV